MFPSSYFTDYCPGDGALLDVGARPGSGLESQCISITFFQKLIYYWFLVMKVLMPVPRGNHILSTKPILSAVTPDMVASFRSRNIVEGHFFFQKSVDGMVLDALSNPTNSLNIIINHHRITNT